MINSRTCTECKQVLPRAKFRKRGGGVHAQCPSCRTKAYSKFKYLKAKTAKAVKLYYAAKESANMEYCKQRLIKEFNEATRHNRDRIKAMEKSGSDNWQTKKWLALRIEKQEKWNKTLRYMLEHSEQIGRDNLSLRYLVKLCDTM